VVVWSALVPAQGQSRVNSPKKPIQHIWVAFGGKKAGAAGPSTRRQALMGGALARLSALWRQHRAQTWVALPYAFYGAFLVAPVVLMIGLSFCEFDVGAPPYKPLMRWVEDRVLQIRLSFETYAVVAKDPFYRAGFFNSFGIASLSTLFCLVLGYPMAYGISRARRQLVWLLLAILPFFTSFLVRVYAWMTLLSPQGLINQGLEALGFQSMTLLHTQGAVIVGMVYSYLPFMIFPLYAAMDKIDPHVVEAAYDLGCRPMAAFWRITVPLTRPGIFAGASLVFIPAMGEFLIPELLGGPTSLTIGRLVWHEFFTNRDWPVAAAIAIATIIILVAPIWLFEKLSSLGEQRKG
jgi:putrescine transport system permease protein